jgi:hypothetical protein
MREKNGFIATSILYSFFLVFITLFVTLIANYMHNQILVKTMNDEVKKDLSDVDSKNLYNMRLGEYVRFVKSNSLEDENAWVLDLFDDGMSWVLVDSKDVGNNKTLTLLSDVYSKTVTTKIGNETTPKAHYITVDLFNKLNEMKIAVGEAEKNPFNLAFMNDGDEEFSLATTELINKVSRSNTLSDLSKNKIFNVTSPYVIYEHGESEDKYYNYELKGFASDTDLDVKALCGLKNDEYDYNDDNTLGYRHIVDDAINNIKYIDYCTTTTEITNTSSNEYNLRLVMTIEVAKDNNYIMGGHGSSIDPYLLTSGVK